MRNENQPGSPGVDLDSLGDYLSRCGGLGLNAARARELVAELRTLRARVGELEADARRESGFAADYEAALRNLIAIIDRDGGQLQQGDPPVSAAARAGCSVHVLHDRAESAEAEVARLRKLFDDAGQGEHNVLALIDHYQRDAMVEFDRRREAEARVKELEEQHPPDDCDHCGNTMDGHVCSTADVCLDCWNASKRRITDLESQLAAARDDLGASELFARALIAKIDRDGGQAQLGESLQYSCHRAIGVVTEAFAELDRIHSGKRLSIEELNTLWQASGRNVADFALGIEAHLRAILETEQALEARVAETLGARFMKLSLVRLFSGTWRAEWEGELSDVWRPRPVMRAHAATLPALLRAILEVEAKS